MNTKSSTALIVGIIVLILVVLVIARAGQRGRILRAIRDRNNTTVTQDVANSSNSTNNSTQETPRGNQITQPGRYNMSLMHGGRERSFILIVPASYTTGKSTPLVMSFHGGYADAESQENLTKMSATADKETFILVYPEAVNKNWNDGRVDSVKDVDDVGFVRALVAELEKKLSLDPKRIYATGMSNGGFFTNRLGCEAPDLFAAIAPVAGGMAPDMLASCKPTQAIPALIINGTGDPIVPYDGGNVGQFIAKGTTVPAPDVVSKWVAINKTTSTAQKTQLSDSSNDGTTTTRETYANGTNGSEVIFLTVNNGGHTWPGGTQYASERRIGKTSRDFSANQVIWDFFKKHTR